MLQDKRVKEKFKREFGVSVDDFVENMNSGSPDINKVKKEGVELKQEIEGVETVAETLPETEFYLSEEEFNDQRMLNRLTEANT